MPDCSTELAGLKFANPILTASGTFGFGAEASGFYDLNRLGGVILKGVTREPRMGNPIPRVTDCPSGMLNAVGLENPGIDAVIDCELPPLARIYKGAIVANVCGFTIEEYTEVAARFDASPSVSLIEINISCPNVAHGGMSFGIDAKSAAAVTRAVRRAVRKPIIMKLSPNVSDIVEIAKACETEGADGLTLINTILGMRIDLRARRPILGNVYGGLSGPAIFPIALRMIHQVYKDVRIPIIGAGGVSSARDAVEMMLAGASAVQIGSAALVDPSACVRIIDEFPALLTELGATSIRELIGTAHKI
ncbi:MAG: dihydroorotate dehydrogenase [Oscillospiraceae bacterium]|nr:dihydroorotate dehydrogenase [Oscillospiraceae bacterium]